MCAVSSPQFAAIPGFAIDDEIGNHYFYYGERIPYPEKRVLSRDGKTFVSYAPEMPNPSIKGQLNATVYAYVYAACGFKITAGNNQFRQSAAPFANWFSNFTSTGVMTYRNGRLVEDDTREFLKLVDFGLGPFPVVVDFIDHPDQILSSGWRTVLRLPEKGVNLIAGSVSADRKLTEYWNLWHMSPDNPSTIYITQGPEIENWSYVGPRDYSLDTEGDFVWQNYRWQVHGRVKSAVGLKEVSVWDGEELFRRFQPQGVKQFDFTMDLTHDKQHNLILVATDENGKRAISGEQWDRNHRLEETHCSDRNNQLTGGFQTTRDGYLLLMGGNQQLATPNKRVDSKSMEPAAAFKNDAFLGAPAFDGAAGGDPMWHEPVDSIRLEKGGIGSPTVSESRRLFHSGDVHVGEGRWEHYFTDNINVINCGYTLWKTEPAKDFTVTKRNYFFQVDADSPLAVFLARPYQSAEGFGQPWDIDWLPLSQRFPPLGTTGERSIRVGRFVGGDGDV